MPRALSNLLNHTLWRLYCVNFFVFISLLPSIAGAQTWTSTPPITSQEFSFAYRYFERVGNEESLPMNIVTSLAQDQRGFIWIGTQAGLVRYDAYRFEKFSDQQFLASEYIKCLWAGPDGRLWIGTMSSGIFVYDPRDNQFTRVPIRDERGAPIMTGAIQAIRGDDKGDGKGENAGGLWVVASESGLYYLPPAQSKTQTAQHFMHDPELANSLIDNRVRSILIDKDETLWVGTANGLQKRSANPAASAGFELITGANMELVGEEIRTIFQAQDGRLWLGFSKGGAAIYTPQTGRVQRVSLDAYGTNSLGDNVVDIITQISADEVWLSRYGFGIYVVDAKDGSIHSHIHNDPAVSGSLAFDQIGALLLDRSGILWLGSWGDGLQKYSANQESIRMLRHSPNNPYGLSRANVRSMLEAHDGKIYVGTDGNGIDIIDRKRGLIGGHRADANRPESTVATAVLALTETADHTIWAGTRQSGLQALPKGQKAWRTYSSKHGLPSNQIRSIYASKRGDLWVGTTLGLALWNKKEKSPEKQFIDFSSDFGVPMNSYVTAFAEQNDGVLWIGSESGLWVYQPDSGSLRQIQHESNAADSLSSNEVNGLLIDHAGNLWIDTARGLDRLISWDGKQARFNHISEQLGRPGLYFGANLLEDKRGRIWTQWFLYDPATESLSDLAKGVGLDIGTAWVNSALKTRDGLFLFGGTKGIALINAEQFSSWDYQAPVVVTGLKLNGISTPTNALNSGLRLDVDQKTFDVEFAALDFLSPDRNRYAYRLLGYQDQWITTTAEHRNISYGNLWPGRYTLQLRGSNRQGNWSEQELSIPITILPAFWQSTWFFALIILSVGGSLVAVYRWRLSRIRAEKYDLQELVKRRTEDILNLGEIGQSLTTTLDIEETFERIHQQVIARVDGNVFGIGFLDEETTRIAVDYMVEDGIRQEAFHYTFEETNRPAVWCVTHEKELITNTLEEVVNYVGSIAPVRSGKPTESIVYLPLFVEKKVIGCMTVQSPRKYAYPPDHLEFLRAIATYVAIAIANSQSHRHLIEAQRQLAQQEKLASLGQLVANVAHEINTPIGAIKSSGDNISNALNTAMSELAELMYKLDERSRHLFLQLIAEVNDGNAILNTREERRIVNETAAQLEAHKISDARRKAGILVQLRAHQHIERYLPLLTHPECERILSAAHHIAAIVNSASNIHVAVDRVSKIVFAFKAFSRISTHHERSLSNLREGMETVLTLYQNKINKGTELICHFEELPDMYCWPDELVQVWVNLIHNALQAMNYQGTLTIGMKQQDKEAVISIADTGPGIPEAIRSKIFDVFFTTKAAGEGSGLGLDIVKKIINKHHGRIEFTTEIGKGTCFFVYLPYEVEG